MIFAGFQHAGGIYQTLGSCLIRLQMKISQKNDSLKAKAYDKIAFMKIFILQSTKSRLYLHPFQGD
jgi:hypothetical protein